MTRTGQRPSVLVVGAGMYVCGRGASGFGTVLPTLVQAQAEGLVGELFVAGESRSGLHVLQGKLTELNRRFGTRATVRGFPDRVERDPVSYREALAAMPRPACAMVVVPDHLHAQVAAEVIRAGVHVLVVKPLAPTVAEAQELIDLLATHQVYGAVEFHKRYDEANLVMRQALADGRLGAIRYVTVEYSQQGKIRETFRSWIAHTNIFQYLGVHYVDLIYFLSGARPVRVLATGQPDGAAAGEPWRLDAIQAVIEWKPSAGPSFISTVATNWVDPDTTSALSDQRITVVGTLGRASSDQKHRGLQFVTGRDGIEDLNPYFSQVYQGASESRPTIEGYGPRSIRQFLADVRELVRGSRQLEELESSRPSFREALVSTAVIEAVRKSLEQGRGWVEIDPAAFKHTSALQAQLQ